MFSPGTRKPNPNSRKDRNLGQATALESSPATPSAASRRASLYDGAVANRPATGTPAPWTSRLSVRARIPPAKNSEKGEDTDSTQPVYVGEFPKVVRDEQASFLQKRTSSGVQIHGGINKETSLSWILCGSKLFVWSYLSPSASRRCVILDLPAECEVSTSRLSHGDDWLLCVVNWDERCKGNNNVGIVMCNKKIQALLYWPDIYSEGRTPLVLSPASPDKSEVTSSTGYGKNVPFRQQQYSKKGSSLIGSKNFTSLIASAIPDALQTCVALGCSSNGELWLFHCSPTAIDRRKVYSDIMSLSSLGNDSGQWYPRSLVWRFSEYLLDEYSRQFFLVTNHEIHCFVIELSHDLKVSRLWSYPIIGPESNLGIKKDLTGQRQIWPLDLQIDGNGKVFSILVATLCEDRANSSSYIEYSVLRMRYKSGLDDLEFNEPIREKVLEKIALHVIIPKARAEEQTSLFSMKLRVGGKPSGSVIILSGEGIAIVSHFLENSTRLYRFDLPYDAGNVLDASVFPSTDDTGHVSWVVLTEKAGMWAIPEKAVLIGGVEPPWHSLAHKGSSDEGPTQDGGSNFSNIATRRSSSEARPVGDQKNPVMTGIAQIEESEALLGHIFHDFLVSGKLSGALEKLQNSGAFEKDGETNVFAQTSKSIVDALAKHWTTTRGAEIVATAVISTQLMDKQQKHQNFLQFLALSKCQEELRLKRRLSLQTIMEHGEKLAGLIQLRELQNRFSQSCLNSVSSPYSNSDTEVSGSLWDLIQLVGERARRNAVLLMDRDNAEVFYSKVSDLEELFYCLDNQLEYIVSAEQPFLVQNQRICELSNACVSLVHTSVQYKNEHHVWYPSSEGLTPWFSQPVVLDGLWHIASFMLRLLNGKTGNDVFANSDIYSNFESLAEVLLEAYSGAVTAKIEREEDHKGLLEEYWNRRDALLGCLYQLVKGFAKAGSEGLRDSEEDQNEEMSRRLYSRLLSIAKRHEGYQSLWQICCDLNDVELLKTLMRESMGPKGGFSDFVFRQLYENRQYPKLLRLGEEFQGELSTFLKRHPDLLWLHEVFLQQFSLASKTLHGLALSQNNGSVSAVEDRKVPGFYGLEPSLAERRHLLNLSKIAAMAGKDAAHDTIIRRVEADLKILQLQEELISHFPEHNDKENIGQRLLLPRDLIKMCLDSQNPQLVLRAFEVFAWTSSSFRRANRNLLEECWKIAVDQDDWNRLYQTSIDEGWNDEDTIRILSGTVLFQASRRCYGPEAETFEGRFDEVLPLGQESSGDQVFMDASSSVEAILMQHKDFPDAGKLMRTALNLGGLQIDIGGDEEAVIPME